MKTKTLLTFSLAFLVLAAFAQDCKLTKDKVTTSGKPERLAERNYSTQSNTFLAAQFKRDDDIYRLGIDLTMQANSSDAADMTVDGNKHPVIIKLANGDEAQAWPTSRSITESKNIGTAITYAQEYLFLASAIEKLQKSNAVSINIRCNGKSPSGGFKSEVALGFTAAEGNDISELIKCLAKPVQTAPQELKIDPQPRKPRAEPLPQAGGMDKRTQEQLISILSSIDENTKAVKESVEASSGAEQEQGKEINEKLEALTEAVEELQKSTGKDDGEFTPRVFGFGAYFKTNFLFSDVDMNYGLAEAQVTSFLSGTSINMSLNAGMRGTVGFRFEVAADFLTSYNEVVKFTDTIYPFTIRPDTVIFHDSRIATFKTGHRLSFFDVGLSPLLVIRRNRVNIYLGFAGSFVRIEGVYTDENPNLFYSEVEKDRIKAFRNGYSVGFTLGGEYLITPHIGIRVESGIKHYGIGKTVVSYSDGYDQPDDSNAGDNTLNIFGSFARIGGSFYF